MTLLRSEFGLMLASIILSFCMNGCSAWSPGNPSTPEASQGTTLTPRPAGTDSRGDITPSDEANRPYPLPDRH
jgi:hypothetical protein